MATARKLPSGSWRCRVYSHSEPLIKDGKPVLDKDGKPKEKKVYKSFTCDNPKPSGRREAERMAIEWVTQKKELQQNGMTIGSALDEYISYKTGVLSESTLRNYIGMKNTYFDEILNTNLSDISNPAIQAWISGLAKRVSPKTVRNVYGLLSAALDMFSPDIRLHVALPARVKPELYMPTDSDIKTLLETVQGTELERAILLAVFGPLRRGEICALESGDIEGNVVHVRKSLVLDRNREWQVKQPKTYSGYRDIVFPESVIEKINVVDGRIIPFTPDALTLRFQKVLKRNNLPKFRFHDLRHYSTSFMHAIGIPDQYIVRRGGWSTDSVMKQIYRDCITEEMEKQSQKINEKIHDFGF